MKKDTDGSPIPINEDGSLFIIENFITIDEHKKKIKSLEEQLEASVFLINELKSLFPEVALYLKELDREIKRKDELHGSEL